MLNKNSKSGKLETLFELDGQTRLIQRSLTPTSKGGESIKTKLRQVDQNALPLSSKEGTGGWEKNQILNHNSSHLSALLPKTSLSEIEFTNSKEVDNAIQDLLPPKELVLSRNFLMQESMSVFELAPGDRVQVFKHLFWLLGIDEAKEKLADRRRELQTTIQVKSDQNTQSQKLRTTLDEIRDWVQKISANRILPTDIATIRNAQTTRPFYADLSLLTDNIQIAEFGVESADYDQLVGIQKKLDQQILTLASSKGKAEQIKLQLQTNKQQLITREQEKNDLEKSIQLLDVQLWDSAIIQDQDVEKKIAALQSQITTSTDSIPYEKFADFGFPVTHISELASVIQSLLHQGTQLSETKKHLQSQTNTLDTQVTQSQEQLKNYEQQKSEMSDSHDKQNKFHCKKIEWDCPYVNMINKNAVWALQKQLWNIDQQIIQTQEKIDVDKEKKKQVWSEEKDIDKKLADLKKFLEGIWRKKLKANADSFTEMQTKLGALQAQQAKIREEQKWLQIKKDKKLTLSTTLTGLEQSIQKLVWDIKDLESNQSSESSQDLEAQEKQLSLLKDNVSSLHASFVSLHALVTEAKAHQLEVKQLEEKLIRIKELHQIFAKELMIVVLQDFLPTLQEVINSYLVQIVDYEIKFLTPQEEWTQLELDIQIIDDKGDRSVKSLSGGQKTVLKLVWMLSVATLFRSKYLFLDETINNLDIDTVAQVAEVLSEFVKSNDISFYVVTHSPQIQQMDIWESVVHIK